MSKLPACLLINICSQLSERTNTTESVQCILMCHHPVVGPPVLALLPALLTLHKLPWPALTGTVVRTMYFYILLNEKLLILLEQI